MLHLSSCHELDTLDTVNSIPVWYINHPYAKCSSDDFALRMTLHNIDIQHQQTLTSQSTADILFHTRMLFKHVIPMDWKSKLFNNKSFHQNIAAIYAQFQHLQINWSISLRKAELWQQLLQNIIWQNNLHAQQSVQLELEYDLQSSSLLCEYASTSIVFHICDLYSTHPSATKQTT